MPTISPPAFVCALTQRIPEHVETHISWVFLDGPDVFKIKKPVRLPFLDFSSLGQRQAACEAEVMLNRRLSPDVYRGVVPVTMGSDGEPVFGGTGEPVDFAVHMRRLPHAERADVMLESGTLSVDHIEALAHHVERFHALAEFERDPAGLGCVAVLTAHVEENLYALAARGPEVLGSAPWETLCERHRSELAARCSLLAQRLASGRVRDGHGDLRLDHVYFGADGTIRVLDCVEFDRAFRIADVCADVAFFAMGLHERGRSDWAERFVARYARDAADHELYAIVDFFLTYWALVRAKVCETRAGQVDGAAARAQHLLASQLLGLADVFASPRSARARLVAVGGVIGTGKSRLAERIGAELCAPVLQSDRLRKQLLGVAPEQRLTSSDAYSQRLTDEVYDELERRARVVLESGRAVIVDASFRTAAQRARWASLARALAVPFSFFECHAPHPVIEERLRARDSNKAVISDARIALLDQFVAGYEPLGDTELDDAMRVDTSGPVARTWQAVSSRVRRP